MITKNNEYMDDGAQVLLTMNSDQTIRDMCYFRERAIIEEKYRNDLIKKQAAELELQAVNLNKKDQEIVEKDDTIAKKNRKLAEKDKELSTQAAIIADLQAQLASLKHS